MPFPSKEQEDLLVDVLNGRKSALVVSGPGTGKTRTAIELARRRLTSLNVHEHVLFLSFSNAAVNRLAEAAGAHFTRQERRQLRFSTFHAYAADLLGAYGRFTGLPPKSAIIDKLDQWLIELETDVQAGERPPEQYIASLARQGQVCFDAMIPLATRLLTASKTLEAVITRSAPLIVVDEFQDTSEQQWQFLKVLGDRAQVVAFGDPNQIIYGSLHAATARRLADFEVWKGIKTTQLPPTNHRCNRTEILSFANALLTGSPCNSVPVMELLGRPQLRPSLAVIWKKIQNLGKERSVAFVVPTIRIAEDIAVGLVNPPADSSIRFPVYVTVGRDEAAYDAVVLASAALRDFAINPAARLANRAAVALVALNAMWNTRKAVRKDDVAKVAKELTGDLDNHNAALSALLDALRNATVLMDHLPLLLTYLSSKRTFKTTATRVASHPALGRRRVQVAPAQTSLFDNLRSERLPKGLYGDTSVGLGTHVLNYHKVKGREFDVVVMVVDPRGESTKTALDERRRLYYVCATRAKEYLLIVHYRNQLGEVLGPVVKPLSK